MLVHHRVTPSLARAMWGGHAVLQRPLLLWLQRSLWHQIILWLPLLIFCYSIFKREIYKLTSRKDTTPIHITFCYHFNSIKITLCNAVCPSLSQSLTSAPYLIRTFTTVTCPEYAALCREVALPDLVWAFTSAPLSRSSWQTSSWPLRLA